MRAAVSVSLALVAGIAGFATAAGLTGSLLAGVLLGLAVAALAGWTAHRRLFLVADAAPTALRVLSACAAVLALVQLVRLTVFMVEPARGDCSLFPSSAFEKRHSCLTAYYVAGQAAADGRNMYDGALYSADNDAARPRLPATLGPFTVDVYEYPPPFLLLPRALGLAAPDFLRLRLLWYGISVAVLLAAMLVTARLLGPAAGTRALLLCPLVWAAPPTVSLLQKGNVQGTIVALSLVAMALFARRRHAAGGLLLAFAIASKLYPGLLVPYLLLKRQWRALAWTSGMGALLVALSLADTGLAPYRSFVDHLPGLLGGESFPGLRNAPAAASNFSVPGLAFKLKALGVPGMGFPAAKAIGWAWTLAALAAVALYVRRRPRDEEQPAVWLAILILGTLRSPFLPQGYAAVPPVWLLTLLAARAEPTTRVWIVTVLAWLALGIYLPVDWTIGLPARVALGTLAQAVAIALPIVVLRRGRPAPQEEAMAASSTSSPSAS